MPRFSVPRHSTSSNSNEIGAVLPIVALLIVILLVFAAFTVDLGAAWAQRTSNQSAADAGVLAAALEVDDATNLEPDLVSAAIDFASRNLGDAYTPGSPAPSEWVTCSDPDRPVGFNPIHDIAGTEIDCISVHGNGIVRVRLPTQDVPTSFARVIGIDEVPTNGFAEADRLPAASGIRPFGITSGVDPGEVCLRTGPVAAGTCDRNEEGDFRALDIPMYGDPDVANTDRICGSAKADERYKINTARGVDHDLIARGADAYRLSACSSSDPGDVGGTPFPNAIPTIQGVGSSLLLEALVSESFAYDAGSPSPTPSLLRQGTKTKREIVHVGTSFNVDNVPLWDYITYSGGHPLVVAACLAPDWNALEIAELVVPRPLVTATSQMTECLKQWDAHGGTDRLFSTSILSSPRLGVVPEFVESSWDEVPVDGSVNEKTILRFRAIFIHALNFDCGPAGCSIPFVPGTGAAALIIPPPSKSLDQLTGFLLPLDLPTALDAIDSTSGVVRLRR